MSELSTKERLDLANEAKALADAEVAALQAELTRVKIKNEKFALQKAKQDLRIERENLLYAEASNGFDYGQFRIAEQISGASVGGLIRDLRAYQAVHEGEPFTVEYCSPGGSVLHGFALFDYVRQAAANGHHVTTVISGYAASMAGVLIQAGDHRVIGAQSYLHLHEVSTGAIGKTFEVVDEAAFAVRLTRQLLDIYVQRSPKKGEKVLPAPWGGDGHVELTTDNLVQWVTRYERWLSAEEALALGFVDEVR